MSLKTKAKNELNRKIKKIVFKAIKPFIPFIFIILGIIMAVCTVADSLFTTDEDMAILEQLSNENYEEQYAEWLKEKEYSPTTIITGGKGLVPTRYVCLANTWIYNNNITFWNENASNNWSI